MLGSYWTNKYDSNSLTDREIINLSNYNWYQDYWVDFKVNNRYFSYFLKEKKVIELSEEEIKTLAEDVKVVVKF